MTSPHRANPDLSRAWIQDGNTKAPCLTCGRTVVQVGAPTESQPTPFPRHGSLAWMESGEPDYPDDGDDA